MSRKILLRSPFAWLIVLLVCGWCGSSAGQENPPRFLLTADGPVGTVQSMLFTPNSQRLLTAGSDKFVSLWGVRREGDDKALRVSLADRLFWEISRGFRGEIFCMSLSPDGSKLAIAGNSARDSSGDIHIFDLHAANFETVLKGHLSKTISLAYSPTGSQLVSVSVDGETRLWNLTTGASEVVRKAAAQLPIARPAVFLSKTTVALSLETGVGRWQIGLYDLNTKRLSSLAQLHTGCVEAIAVQGNTGAWASADRAGNVFLWPSRTANAPALLRRDRVASALAFGKAGKLFISTRVDRGQAAHLELWDTNDKTLMDEVLVSKIQHNPTCAVSPDGRYVATVEADDGAIVIYPLLDANGKALVKPLSKGAPARVAGSASGIWRVAFDRGNSYRVAIADRQLPPANWDEPRGTLSRAFDPVKLETLPLKENKNGWGTEKLNGAGAKVERLDQLGREIEVTLGREKAVIRLDPALQGPAECYCWLHDTDGKIQAIAIGTSQQFGIFIYEAPKKEKCRLIRYFRDHYGMVTSLSCSTDGKLLASSSVDGTVKFWSLNGLLTAGRDFQQEAAWGAILRPKGNNRLVVTKSDADGIAARRNLNVDDEIIRVIYNKQGKPAETAVAAEMLSALENTPLWESVVLSVLTKGRGATRRVLMIPAWEPLATMVLDRRGEWVMWTPQGYYDASVAGDELVGWILNGTDDRPAAKFFRADRFREQLEKPDVLKKLLTSRSLPAALETAKEPVLVNVQDRVTEIAKRLPTIKILKPQHDAVLAKGENIDVQVQVEFPNQDDVAAYDASLYINGIPVKDRQRTVKGGTANYQWQTTPPNQYNSLRIVAERTNNTRGGYADARVAVRSESDPKKGKLHFIGLAAEKYTGTVSPLKFCCSDVESVATLMRKTAGKNYEVNEQNFMILRDKQITAEAVRKLPVQLAQQAGAIQPQDLLVVYLSGHGVALSSLGAPEYYFIPPDEHITGFDEDQIRKYGVSWNTIRALTEIPCRKVFLIDTCFDNPTITEANAAANLEMSVRPLSRRETLVITGCGLGQKSYEGKEHGIFTTGVLEGLGGIADGFQGEFGPGPRDHIVELRELATFILMRVPQLSERSQLPPQQPTISSADLGFVPLVNY